MPVAEKTTPTPEEVAELVGPIETNHSTELYVLMQDNAASLDIKPVVSVLGTLALCSVMEDNYAEEHPNAFPKDWENRNIRLTTRRPDREGSPIDIRPRLEKLDVPEAHNIIADAVRIADAILQSEPKDEHNITPLNLQGKKTDSELPPDDVKVVQRISHIKAMLGSSQGTEIKSEIENVTETHFATRIPGYTLVQRVVKAKNPAMVELPTGMSEIRGNTVVLSLKRAMPSPDGQPQGITRSQVMKAA